MNPREGGNYTQPIFVRDTWTDQETIVYLAYVGGVEIDEGDATGAVCLRDERAVGFGDDARRQRCARGVVGGERL